jgi:hypothetical protein
VQIAGACHIHCFIAYSTRWIARMPNAKTKRTYFDSLSMAPVNKAALEPYNITGPALAPFVPCHPAFVLKWTKADKVDHIQTSSGLYLYRMSAVEQLRVVKAQSLARRGGRGSRKAVVQAATWASMTAKHQHAPEIEDCLLRLAMTLAHAVFEEDARRTVIQIKRLKLTPPIDYSQFDVHPTDATSCQLSA